MTVVEAAAPSRAAARIAIRELGTVDYEPTVEAMRAFTARRGPSHDDELWVLEHPPVYTLGQGADPAHGPRVDAGIPVVRCERGGQITYHGPGQAVVYTLVDLARAGLQVRAFVRLLEAGIIDLLAELGINGERRDGAPGVYVDGAKIAALGIRVSRGCAFHGVALNVDMDLAPFAAIDPCGYAGLRVTRTRDFGVAAGAAELGRKLAESIAHRIAHA